LERDGIAVPALSTVHEILRRHDRIHPAPGAPFEAHRRFEKEAPNLLWQMDFKGWVRLKNGARCYPLTIVDDHSRYVPCLKACSDQQRVTVQSHLEAVFGRYGLPDAIFVDNGPPWSDSSGRHWTRLRVWLTKLGVELIYSRPYHPQGRGKNERFHRTLNEEVFALRRFEDLAAVQRAFDIWREIYNFERPHQALKQQVPAERYRPSGRAMPDAPASPKYGSEEIVRIVPATKDYISFKGRLWKVPEAFRGEPLAIRPRGGDGKYGVFFASYRIATIDLNNAKTVGYVPEQVSAMSSV
jgi:transposase InsO family protein